MAVPLQVKQFAELVLKHLTKHQIDPKEDAYHSTNGQYFPATLTINIVPNGHDVDGGQYGYTTEFTLQYGNKTYAGKRGWGPLGIDEDIHEVI